MTSTENVSENVSNVNKNIAESIPDSFFQECAEQIYYGDALFVTAGAGMSVDSGLPDVMYIHTHTIAIYVYLKHENIYLIYIFAY